MQLNYKTLGEGSPILIMHGIFGLMDNWMTVAKALAENHQVFLLDLRNHGRSPHSEEFTYPAMSDDVKEFIDTHQLHQPVVIGHSMGGKVAMYFAGRYPDLFSKLIVVDIAPKYYPVHHRSILDTLQRLPVATLQSRQQADEELAQGIPEPDVRQFLLKSLYRADAGGFDWRFNLPVLNQQIENVGQKLPDSFRSDKPILFIRGGRSSYVTDTDMEDIHHHFPKAQLATVADAGHWVHAEKPQELLQLVQNFID